MDSAVFKFLVMVAVAGSFLFSGIALRRLQRPAGQKRRWRMRKAEDAAAMWAAPWWGLTYLLTLGRHGKPWFERIARRPEPVTVDSPVRSGVRHFYILDSSRIPELTGPMSVLDDHLRAINNCRAALHLPPLPRPIPPENINWRE